MKAITKIADLVADDRSENKGTERGHAMIEQSPRQYGLGDRASLTAKGRIIAGNKTVENAGAVGLED